MFDVFGTEMPLAVRFFLAFLIVLGLIGAAAWAVRRFGSARLSGAVRGRQPRLAVVDYASVDARRRLILVRRDNVEHLVMIGGPTDIVVEPNIVRAVPATREPVVPRAPAPAAEPLPRPIPLPEAPSNGSWPLQPEPPAPPAPPRRAPRIEPLHEEHEAAPAPQSETPARTQRDVLSALAEDLAAHVPTAPAIPAAPPRSRPAPPRQQPAETRAEQRVEPHAAPRGPVQPGSAEAAAVDQSLAEMAQRLEAALRKPKAAAVAPETEHADVAEAAAPLPPSPARAPRLAELRPVRADSTPKEAPKEAFKEGVKEGGKESAKESKALYDTLEQEMASLLGRPTGKT